MTFVRTALGVIAGIALMLLLIDSDCTRGRAVRDGANVSAATVTKGD